MTSSLPSNKSLELQQLHRVLQQLFMQQQTFGMPTLGAGSTLVMCQDTAPVLARRDMSSMGNRTRRGRRARATPLLDAPSAVVVLKASTSGVSSRQEGTLVRASKISSAV